MVRELEAKYDTYFILPNLTSYYHDREIHRRWTDLLGEKVIRLEDPKGISDLIAAVIGPAEGVVGSWPHRGRPARTGRGCMARAVCQALVSIGPASNPA